MFHTPFVGLEVDRPLGSHSVAQRIPLACNAGAVLSQAYPKFQVTAGATSGWWSMAQPMVESLLTEPTTMPSPTVEVFHGRARPPSGGERPPLLLVRLRCQQTDDH